jgi:hypothetical protein
VGGPPRARRGVGRACRDEAAERSAIGRAYYAAFGMARTYLRRQGVRLPPGGLPHVAVWDRFHAVPDRAHRRIADRGRHLRRWRTRADYDDQYPGLTREARTSVAFARGILTDFDSLP